MPNLLLQRDALAASRLRAPEIARWLTALGTVGRTFFFVTSTGSFWPGAPIGRCYRIAVIGPRRLFFSGRFVAKYRTRLSAKMKRSWHVRRKSVQRQIAAILKRAPYGFKRYKVEIAANFILNLNL
jgi:hypothetical protein